MPSSSLSFSVVQPLEEQAVSGEKFPQLEEMRMTDGIGTFAVFFNSSTLFVVDAAVLCV